MKEMDELITIAAADDENEVAFPYQGEEFDVWAVRVPDCEEPPDILEGYLDKKLARAMHDFGGTCNFMCDPYFSDADIAKVEHPGLWKLRVRVHYSTWSDWESGHSETNLELCVQSAERVQ